MNVTKTVFSLALMSVPLMACQTASGPAWSCSAESMVSGSYSGGSTASIHLSAYSSGGTYGVTKSADGKTASGKTGDGTPFTCVAPK